MELSARGRTEVGKRMNLQLLLRLIQFNQTATYAKLVSHHTVTTPERRSNGKRLTSPGELLDRRHGQGDVRSSVQVAGEEGERHPGHQAEAPPLHRCARHRRVRDLRRESKQGLELSTAERLEGCEGLGAVAGSEDINMVRLWVEDKRDFI